MTASMIVMSHLSDAQELMNSNKNNDINFAKYIILQTEGDLTKEIDADEMYVNFLRSKF